MADAEAGGEAGATDWRVLRRNLCRRVYGLFRGWIGAGLPDLPELNRGRSL